MNLGENLIFLISLPRSGSTLLQHIIAGHSSVGATAEPWVLFPSALALRPQALRGHYNANIGQIALSEFLTQLDDGEEQYYTAVRKMALHLYDAFLVKHGKKRFLDKTSRYYLILPEMFRIFPKAQYIFLLRNPLALFASFLESMVFQDWRRLGEAGIRGDLLYGYRLMRQGIRYFGDNAIVLKYEDLVADPEATVREICKNIGLEFETEMLHYGKTGVLSGKLVDPKSIHRHQTPVEDYVNAWKSKFTTRQERNLVQAFLAHLGPELINSLGYSYEELVVSVSEKDEGWAPLVRWDVLMIPPDHRSPLQKLELELTYVCQKIGTVGGLKYLGRRFVNVTINSLYEGLSTFLKQAGNLAIMRPVRQFVRSILSHRCEQHASSSAKSASSDCQVLGPPSQISCALLRGWRDPAIPERQHAAFAPVLRKMYEGESREDFVALATAVQMTGLEVPMVIEVGCGSGWNSEVLVHLLKRPVKYIGLDYSPSMTAAGKESYPDREFLVGDAVMLPFQDGACDILLSGTVLMHLLSYQRAIQESRRVARKWCIFHTVPVARKRATTVLRKSAYGIPVVEIVFNEEELLKLITNSGLQLWQVFESVPHDYLSRLFDEPILSRTYLCEVP